MFDIHTEAYLRSRAHSHPQIRPIPDDDRGDFPIFPVAIILSAILWTGVLIAAL